MDARIVYIFFLFCDLDGLITTSLGCVFKFRSSFGYDIDVFDHLELLLLLKELAYKDSFVLFRGSTCWCLLTMCQWRFGWRIIVWSWIAAILLIDVNILCSSRLWLNCLFIYDAVNLVDIRSKRPMHKLPFNIVRIFGGIWKRWRSH